MKFVMEFDIDGAAFHYAPYYNSKQKKETIDRATIAYKVVSVSSSITAGADAGTIMDVNGNSVGSWRIKGR